MKTDFQKKEERRIAMYEFEKQVNKLILEDARKPWWVKQQEYGDYHYNDFDMEPEESFNEEVEEDEPRL